MASERRILIYRGRVQGVGFRWQAVRAVEGLAVTGYVRNRGDGAVELVLEGESSATRAALKRIEAALGQNISGRDESTGPATGEFPRFEIRR